jgi:hypothetical protein
MQEHSGAESDEVRARILLYILTYLSPTTYLLLRRSHLQN